MDTGARLFLINLDVVTALTNEEAFAEFYYSKNSVFPALISHLTYLQL